MTQLIRVGIVGGSRIPFCRSNTSYTETSNSEMMTTALKGLVDRFELKNKELGEVVLGAVLKRSRDFNMARECTLNAGLSPKTPAHDIQKACGTSLEAAIDISNKIALGQIDCGIAGGVDTSSDVPIELKDGLSHALVAFNSAKSAGDRLKLLGKLSPRLFGINLPAIKEPRTKLSMGEHCELMAQEWKIPRPEQDQLALDSHTNASTAYKDGFFDDLVVPYKGVKKDNNIRGNTAIDKLSKLRAAFEKSEKGTLTAGNSSPLTDGASAVMLCSESYAKENNLEVQAWLTWSQSASVDFEAGDGLLMAPAIAVPQMLERANMKLQDFDFYEIHEAFAAQVLCTLKAWESSEFCQKHLGLNEPLGSIDKSKLNTKGGSIAIGHPFAATGSRIIASLAKMLSDKGSGKGLISICTAGGMGVTAILER